PSEKRERGRHGRSGVRIDDPERFMRPSGAARMVYCTRNGLELLSIVSGARLREVYRLESGLRLRVTVAKTELFKGPSDLAKLVTESWHRCAERAKAATPSKEPRPHAAISDAGVERLVELLYRASFTKNEGRSVRVRVLVNEPQDQSFPPFV